MGERKITLGEMRDSGLSRLLIYCGDYHCAHSVVIDSGRWGDDVRLSDLEPKFTCQLFERARVGHQMKERAPAGVAEALQCLGCRMGQSCDVCTMRRGDVGS